MAGVGVGTVGRPTLPSGDAYARLRLLLAKRAGLLSPQKQLPTQPGASQAMWRGISSNLSARARVAGYENPLVWLREGAAAGGNLPYRR